MSANHISSSMGEMNTGKRAVVDVSKDQFGHPLVNQEVQQLDTTNNELLLENVEIIESLDVGNRVTGMVEEEEMDQQGQQNMYMSQPQNHLEKCVGVLSI
ncbi:hypothetical protein Hamer_G009942 [Homarus americanus]|uniref:Uncharacterized protein n=1 Tax=Homarus americanus TaxID=6706 RepID=A0A8J5NAG4_HOMAM|nr:hypothetical protein Hamer_G009942 [Homarus americanus]